MEFDKMGWRVRRPTVQDAESVLALMRAFDTAISGEPDTDLEDIKHDWGQVRLDQDTWIVFTEQGELIGYAALLPHVADGLRIDLYSSPDLIESDLPRQLLRLCQARAGEIASQSEGLELERLVAYIVHSNHSYRSLFEQAGYVPRRYIFQMRFEMPTAPAEPVWPQGICVRAFQPGVDELQTYELVQDTFDRPGRARPGFEQWRAHMLRPESFEAELWTLAFAGDTMVGFCLGFDYSQEGWVRQLGVVDDWRGRGLGSALLQNSFSVFYQRGKRRVGLTTESDNMNALYFYQRVGMGIKRQYDEYVKTIL